MTRIFKTKNFVRWAKKEKVFDFSLCEAIFEIKKGISIKHGAADYAFA